MAKKRVVRKQPLAEKIRTYPFDLFLWLNEARLSIDWDSYCHYTIPVGSLLTILFTLLGKLSDHYTLANDRRENQLFRTDYSTYQRVKSRAISGNSEWTEATPRRAAGRHWAWVLNLLMTLLFVAALANSINVLWFPYRNYTLLSTSTDCPPPRGSHVSKQSVSNSTEKGFLDKLFAYFEDQTMYDDSDSDGETTYEVNLVEKDVWVLHVWDPLKFQLHVVATFSPVTLFLVRLLLPSVPLWKLMVLIALTGISGYCLVIWFLQLVNDKQVVYQETFNEFNKKFVIPKTSVLKKNAVVDATHGSRAAASKVVHDDLAGHLQNDFAFVTHDIHGNIMKSVRADKQPSRPPSPRKMNESVLSGLLTYQRQSRYDHSMADLYDFSHQTDASHASWMTLSTPFVPRAGNESFARPISPFKSPSRLTYNERTQLSPSRSHYSPSRSQYSPGRTPSHTLQTFSSRPGSPQRSPSPSKRPWA